MSTMACLWRGRQRVGLHLQRSCPRKPTSTWHVAMMSPSNTPDKSGFVVLLVIFRIAKTMKTEIGRTLHRSHRSAKRVTATIAPASAGSEAKRVRNAWKDIVFVVLAIETMWIGWFMRRRSDWTDGVQKRRPTESMAQFTLPVQFRVVRRWPHKPRCRAFRRVIDVVRSGFAYHATPSQWSERYRQIKI